MVALSVAVTVNETGAPEGLVHSTLIFEGSVSTGPFETVTLNCAIPTLSCASYARQVTTVVPRGKVEPDAGSQVTGTLPLTASTAEAVYVTTGLLALVRMSPGTVTTGATTSRTKTGKLADALPKLSVAVQ